MASPNDNTDFNDTKKELLAIVGIILVGLGLLLVIALIIWTVFSIPSGIFATPCFWSSKTYECKNYRVDQCLQGERYTLDQCVILVGGGE